MTQPAAPPARRLVWCVWDTKSKRVLVTDAADDVLQPHVATLLAIDTTRQGLANFYVTACAVARELVDDIKTEAQARAAMKATAAALIQNTKP